MLLRHLHSIDGVRGAASSNCPEDLHRNYAHLACDASPQTGRLLHFFYFFLIKSPHWDACIGLLSLLKLKLYSISVVEGCYFCSLALTRDDKDGKSPSKECPVTVQ